TGRGPRGEAEAPLHERTTQRHVGSSDGGRDSCSRPIEKSKPPGFGTSRITAETRRARRISFFEKLFLRVLRVSAVIFESFLAAVAVGKPGEAFVGGALRAVGDADRAGVAQLVEGGEEGQEGDLSGVVVIDAGAGGHEVSCSVR